MDTREAELSELKEAAPQFAQSVESLEHERDEYKKLYELLRQENEQLKRGLLLPKSDAQLSLAILDLCLSADAPADADEAQAELPDPREKPEQKPAHERRRRKRRPLPEHLPRVQIAEYRPASHVVVELVRKKYVRKPKQAEGTDVLIAPPPELPIERGLAGPGVLADTLVRRWQDHLPLHRLEGIYEREGMRLSRSTVCGWHLELAQLAQPLVHAMKQDAYRAPYLCTDATGPLCPPICRVPARSRRGVGVLAVRSPALSSAALAAVSLAGARALARTAVGALTGRQLQRLPVVSKSYQAHNV